MEKGGEGGGARGEARARGKGGGEEGAGEVLEFEGRCYVVAGSISTQIKQHAHKCKAL